MPRKAAKPSASSPHADLKILDPVWTTAYITRTHGYLVYDTLFGTDESNQVKPQMVERVTASADGMKYTFALRDRLRWHDGQPGALGTLRGVAQTLGQKGPLRPAVSCAPAERHMIVDARGRRD